MSGKHVEPDLMVGVLDNPLCGLEGTRPFPFFPGFLEDFFKRGDAEDQMIPILAGCLVEAVKADRFGFEQSQAVNGADKAFANGDVDGGFLNFLIRQSFQLLEQVHFHSLELVADHTLDANSSGVDSFFFFVGFVNLDDLAFLGEGFGELEHLVAGAERGGIAAGVGSAGFPRLFIRGFEQSRPAAHRLPADKD